MPVFPFEGFPLRFRVIIHHKKICLPISVFGVQNLPADVYIVNMKSEGGSVPDDGIIAPMNDGNQPCEWTFNGRNGKDGHDMAEMVRCFADCRDHLLEIGKDGYVRKIVKR